MLIKQNTRYIYWIVGNVARLNCLVTPAVKKGIPIHGTRQNHRCIGIDVWFGQEDLFHPFLFLVSCNDPCIIFSSSDLYINQTLRATLNPVEVWIENKEQEWTEIILGRVTER